MRISMIVAIDQQNAIGHKGDQLAYISKDLKRFKELTSGNPIIMGRKTFEALPKGALPNRTNIVLSHNTKLNFPDCEMVSSVEEIIEKYNDKQEMFVIGGAEIYKIFLPLATKIYLTHIHQSFKNVDTWFPVIDRNNWNTINKEGPFTDEKSGLIYSYETLERKK